MKEDSNANIHNAETHIENEGPCAGGVEKKKRNYRRLRSVETNRIIHVKKEKKVLQPVFDPTAWFVVTTKKRWQEVMCRDFLNSKAGFINEVTQEHYTVEAYAATQLVKGKEKTVILGKVFVRVDEENRADVLKKCQLLKQYVTHTPRFVDDDRRTVFVRIPDKEILQMQEILRIAVGTVEYSEDCLPAVNDTVEITDGILSESETLKGVRGTVETVNGSKYATVILETTGCFKFKLSVESLGKVIS